MVVNAIFYLTVITRGGHMIRYDKKAVCAESMWRKGTMYIL